MAEIDGPNIMHEISLLFMALIIAYFIYRAYAYLGNLDKCTCAPTKIVQHLKMIELYYLCIILGGVIFNIIYLIYNFNYAKLLTKNNYLVAIVVIYVLSVFAFYAYYVYNVIEFKMQLDPKCACANQWQNNIIYLHVLYLSLPIILTIMSALFKFKLNTSIITMIIVFVVAVYYYEQYLVNGGKTTESMISMLGNYKDMVFKPKIYDQDVVPFDAKDANENPDYGNFSPRVGQPLQKYHQMRTNEYPDSKPNMGDNIFTPLSTHESIILDYRKKMPNDLYQ